MAQITEKDVYEVLKTVYDPEIPVNIVDLGLIYGVQVEEGKVHVLMTLTAPGCPMGAYLVQAVEMLLRRKFPELKEVKVELTFDPPWTIERLTPEGRETLRKMGFNV